MKYKAILFDLDDTLLDFAASEEIALNKIYSVFPISCDLETFKSTYKKINRSLWDLIDLGKKLPSDVKKERFVLLMQALALPLDSSSMASFYESVLGEEIIWFPGVEECLNSLQQHYRLGIITNGVASVQEKKYKLSGLHARCLCCVISESVGLAKPDPKIFEIALNHLGTKPEETLMVGDSLASDYLGAIYSNLDFCWINPSEKPSLEHLPPPRYIIKSTAELSKLLI